MTLSVNDFTAGDVITASAMNTNFATIEGYVNSSPGLAQLTGATFSGTVTFSAGLTSTGGTTALGTTTATTLTTSGAGASANNVQITFAEGYAIHADNDGSGSDSSRLWFESPNEGEIILGPRGGGSFLNRLRLRATTTLIEGAVDLNGNLDVSGTTTLGSNLTFTGSVSGANPIAKMTYVAAGSSSLASHTRTNSPAIFVNASGSNPTSPTTGDIWIGF